MSSISVLCSTVIAFCDFALASMRIKAVSLPERLSLCGFAGVASRNHFFLQALVYELLGLNCAFATLVAGT